MDVFPTFQSERRELKDCPKIWLTDSVRTWDPQSDLLAQQESTYSVTQGRKVGTVRALRSDEIETSLNDSAIAIVPDPFYRKIGRLHDEETARVKRISRVSTDICRLDLDPTQLQRRFGGVRPGCYQQRPLRRQLSWRGGLGLER